MSYQKTVWKNREVERPRTYNIQENEDGTITLIPAEGAIIEPGTPITAQVMQNIEDGIEALDNTLKSHLADYANLKADYEKEATVFYIGDTDTYDFRAANNYLSRYYKKNGWVHLQIQCSRKDGQAFSGDESIYTMPVGFRPKRSIDVPAIIYDDATQMEIMRIMFYDFGNISIGRISSYKNLRLQISYYAGGGTV